MNSATTISPASNFLCHTVSLIRSATIAFLLVSYSLGVSLAEEFRLTDTNGRVHTLSGYKGQWVLVNFWATWCPPCLEEIPEFAALYAARKGKDLVVIGVAVDFDDQKQVFEFAETQGMNYPLVLGDDKIGAQFGKISVLPTTFLFDPKGKKNLHRVGPVSRAELEKLIGR